MIRVFLKIKYSREVNYKEGLKNVSRVDILTLIFLLS